MLTTKRALLNIHDQLVNQHAMSMHVQQIMEKMYSFVVVVVAVAVAMAAAAASLLLSSKSHFLDFV